MTSTRRPATPEEFEAIRARLAGLSHSEKVDLASRTKPIAEKRVEKQESHKQKHSVPKTDDELHEAIKRDTGYDIPRVAVCEDHCAPFAPIADGFFNRQNQILIMKSREAGGTLNVSILQYEKCKYVPRHEGVTFGAIEQQARRAYEYVQTFTFEETEDAEGNVTRTVKSEIEGEPMRSKTKWKHGSSLMVIIGTVSGVNSPHPNTVHCDELDIMGRDVWLESRNMSSSSRVAGREPIPALDVVTSTRKSMHGLMQELIDENDEAIASGYEPPWAVYAYCVFEIAEEVPECRRAPEEQRRTRLAELNRDPCETCSCHQIIKGEWGENNPRTLESVCQGKFFKSRGWMAHEDVKRKFRNNPQVQWEAQMECRRPMADGLYLPGWSRRRFSTTGWQPRPDLGKIWLGADWGGSAENALIWFQGPLTAPVTINGPGGQVTVPMGAYVIFDELLIANVGAGKLGDMAVAKEIAWRRQIMGFRVTARFSDPAGKQQRDDWREHNPPLKTSWYLPNRDFDPTVKVLQDLVADQRYWIDSRAARHMDDIEAWRQKNGREIHDEATHSCSAARYGLNNTEVLERRRGHKRSSNAMPVAVARPTDSSLAGIVSGGGDPFADERKWREGLGESFDNRPYGR